MTDPTRDPVPSSPSMSGRLGWFFAAGLLAVLAGLGARKYLDRSSTDDAPRYIAGPMSPDPAWTTREQEVAKLVEEIRKSKPAPDDKSPVAVTTVPENPRPDLSAFKIATDHRTFDLRGWKPVKPGDAPHTAGVTMTRRLRLTKDKPADRIDFIGRTAGADLVMRCEEPNPDKAQVFASEKKPVVDGNEMIEQRLSVDVADVPVGKEFDLTAKTTHWNSLQAPGELWLSATGSDGSKLLSLLVLFPPDRPFKGGGLRTGPADGQLTAYTGTMLVFQGAGGSWVYWEVPGPRPGHTYRLDWRW